MNIVNLMASPFFGGPERQVLGLARHLPAHVRTIFLSFPERGLAQPFIERAAAEGFETVTLRENTPHLFRCAAEIAEQLRRCRADVLYCHGYKPDVIGWLAARRAGVPVVAVAHGWTAVTWKVRAYETLDRLVMHGMDCTVCVSASMAQKVRRIGVPSSRIRVIRNAVLTEPFDKIDPQYRTKLRDFFAWQPAAIVGAAGRLSPEKGFDQFIDAAALVHEKHPAAGFVLFGDGPLRAALAQRIVERKLDGVFILAGFRTDVARFLPFLDVSVLSSHTEGLPNVVMEAMAARVPVVATAVGGTPEVVADGVTGWLVPPRDVTALANRLNELLSDESARRRMGDAARQRIEEEFTFARMSEQYEELFERLGRRLSDGRFREASLTGDMGVIG